MEYTRGEWKAKKNALGIWTIHTELEYIGQIDRRFNAQLISAAPNMYEALKFVSDELGAIALPKDNPDHTWEDAAIIKISEALSKAEGLEGV